VKWGRMVVVRFSYVTSTNHPWNCLSDNGKVGGLFWYKP